MKGIICAVVLAGLTATGAMAAEKNWTVEGTALSISSPCAKVVAIEPSGDGSGKVQVAATGRQKEIDRLEILGGATASIGIKDKRCPSNVHFEFGFFKWGINTDPTLELTVRVPAGAPIEIKESHSTDYHVGEVGGPLRVDLSGSGDVDADIVRVRLDADLSGSGSLSVVRAEAAGMGLAISGSGHASVDEGAIGSLTVKSSGNGDADIDAAVTDADLAVSGSGDVRVREASGQVRRNSHGSGEISIGGR